MTFPKQFLLSGLGLSVGLSGKSASPCIDVDGRAKRWMANPYPFLRHRGKPGGARLIPAISIDQAQKYLGVPISVVEPFLSSS